MSSPLFIHILSTGDIWAGAGIDDTPPGTILATIKINNGLKLQKIGSLGGNSGSYTATGHTGKFGKEVS